MSRIQEIRQSTRTFLNDRTPQERRLIAFAAAFFVVAVVYLLLLEPAIVGRSQLSKNLPALRQQVAELQGMTSEATTLSAAVSQPVGPVTRETIEAALARQGLKAQSVTVTGEFIRVQFSAVPFPALTSWLDDARRTARLSVTEASITSLPQAGSVDASLTLRQQRSAG